MQIPEQKVLDVGCKPYVYTRRRTPFLDEFRQTVLDGKKKKTGKGNFPFFIFLTIIICLFENPNDTDTILYIGPLM